MIDANVVSVGPATYSISECSAGECYQAARQMCPYGFDRLSESSQVAGVNATPAYLGTGAGFSVRREKDMLVRCYPPVFCDHEACPYGYQCVASKRYPGRSTCAI